MSVKKTFKAKQSLSVWDFIQVQQSFIASLECARNLLEVKTSRAKRYIGLFYKGFPLCPVSHLVKSALAYRKTFISQIAPLHLYTV